MNTWNVNYLFYRYNISYGDLKANEDQIVEAAKGADLHNSILNFKNGYETEVGNILTHRNYTFIPTFLDIN